ncbi:MAG: IS1634 family transposase [Desulfobacterales bacterium]|nr:IS1634 family transposase [Desulfobacterales bacterium]
MYIKKVRKSHRNSKKVYEYLHLVENVRTERGPRQRLILNLGSLDIPADKYKELANCIEAMITGQMQLFSADPTIEKHARKALQKIRSKQSLKQPDKQVNHSAESIYKNVDITSLQAGEMRSLGPEYVCHSIWNELKFNDILTANGISEHLLPLLEALVVGRLVTPGSERHTWQWAENRSAIYELSGTPLRTSLNALYRAGDSLFGCKDALETHLARQEKELFSLPERMCLIDLTNTYFEGRAAGNPKAKRGRSKEKRSDCKLLTLALVVDEHGFAKYSRLYPGNQAECNTLKQIIENMIQIRPNLAKDRTVVIDASIATKENIEYLKENRFHYIVVSRGKADFTVADTLEMKIIRQTDEYSLEVKRREKNGQAFLLCRSSSRKGKDYGIRNRQEQLFIDRLQYYHDGLSKKGHTKLYDKVIELIGRLREKYPQASKQYDVTVTAEDKTAKSVKAQAIVWKKRVQYDDISRFDGCYVLRTDRLDLTDKQIWETYVMLTRLESAFRSMKSSLGLRPNFHQNPERADTHLFISVLAYHILHTIEYRLHQSGDHRSWKTIRDILSTHQRLTIEYNVKEQNQIERHHLRLCSSAEPEHKQIYKNLGLKNIPLSRKRYAVKSVVATKSVKPPNDADP